MMKRLIIAIIFSLNVCILSSQTFTAQTDVTPNLWTQSATWLDEVAAAGTPNCSGDGTITIIIPAGKKVRIVDTVIDLSGCNVELIVGGILIIKNEGELESGLKLGANSTILVEVGGLIDSKASAVGMGENNGIWINDVPSWTGGGGQDFNGDGVVYNENVVLPIDLLSFDVSIETEGVFVRWSTATELNNAYFTVLRSIDGAVFYPISEIQGAGFSSSVIHYTFIDHSPLQGISYYRLKQTDFDGQSELFEIKSVNGEHERRRGVVIFPNPVEHNVILVGSMIPPKVSVTDINGKKVTDINIDHSVTDRVEINLSNLKSGIYVIYDGVSYHRISKQ